ncbi:MAG: hypothetical protein ACJAYU_002952 [Bradymonadia bacterium]|jgi:hypothetical protein
MFPIAKSAMVAAGASTCFQVDRFLPHLSQARLGGDRILQTGDPYLRSNE